MSNTTASLGLKVGGEAPKLPQPVAPAGSPGWTAGNPPPAPPVWPNRLDGDYRINGVVQTQLPHVYVPVTQSGNYPVLPSTSSYYWASLR